MKSGTIVFLTKRLNQNFGYVTINGYAAACQH